MVLVLMSSGCCWVRGTEERPAYKREESCFDFIRATGPGVSAPLVVCVGFIHLFV